MGQFFLRINTQHRGLPPRIIKIGNLLAYENIPIHREVVAVEFMLKAIAATGTSIENYLHDYCDAELPNNETLQNIVEYILPDLGFRLRPFLLRIGYESGNCSFDEILPISAAIELIHLSTLIHDDILDGSPMRNNKLSVFKKWGVGIALTTGTIMASTGFKLLSESLNKVNNSKNNIAILSIIRQAYIDTYVGQFVDIESEGIVTFSEEEYFKMITDTTASLFRVSLVVGAMLWGAPGILTNILSKIGIYLGIAYQLRDDVLDIIEKSSFTGKPEMVDIIQRKMRLPMIHLLSHLDADEHTRVLNIFKPEHPINEVEINYIIGLLYKVGSVEYVINKTKEYCNEAIKLIDKLPPEASNMSHQLKILAQLVSSF